MRTPIPRTIPERENIKANSEVKPYFLTPEELEKYKNLSLPVDRNGEKIRMGVGRIQ